jgi:hypothetical protein
VRENGLQTTQAGMKTADPLDSTFLSVPGRNKFCLPTEMGAVRRTKNSEGLRPSKETQVRTFARTAAPLRSCDNRCHSFHSFASSTRSSRSFARDDKFVATLISNDSADLSSRQERSNLRFALSSHADFKAHFYGFPVRLIGVAEKISCFIPPAVYRG